MMKNGGDDGHRILENDHRGDLRFICHNGGVLSHGGTPTAKSGGIMRIIGIGRMDGIEIGGWECRELMNSMSNGSLMGMDDYLSNGWKHMLFEILINRDPLPYII